MAVSMNFQQPVAGFLSRGTGPAAFLLFIFFVLHFHEFVVCTVSALVIMGTRGKMGNIEI